MAQMEPELRIYEPRGGRLSTPDHCLAFDPVVINVEVVDSVGSDSDRLGFSPDFGSLGYVARSLFTSEKSGFAVTPLGLTIALSKV